MSALKVSKKAGLNWKGAESRRTRLRGILGASQDLAMFLSHHEAHGIFFVKKILFFIYLFFLSWSDLTQPPWRAEDLSPPTFTENYIYSLCVINLDDQPVSRSPVGVS